MSIESRQLRHFVALAETLNYRAAAERLCIVQPALTSSIRRLEEDLGCMLFQRTRRGTTLTVAGSEALKPAKRALTNLSRFSAVARDADAGAIGTLVVGYVASAAYQVLPKVLPMFRATYPGVRLTLIERPSEGVVELVEDRLVDLGITRTPLPRPTPADIRVFLKEHFVAALPDCDRWAGRESVRMTELSEEPFVVYASPSAKSLTYQVCRSAGFIPHVAQEASGLPTLMNLVKCGLGIALLPEVVQRWPLAGVVFCRIEDISPDITMDLALVAFPSEASPATVRFQEVLHRAFPAVPKRQPRGKG